MTFKLACADFTFPLMTHEGALDLIAILGFDGVDIGLFEKRSHLWPSKEFRALTRSARTLKRKTTDRGLAIADVFLQTEVDFVPYAANHPQAARRRRARDWFSKTLDYAAESGSAHLTALPGVYFDDEPRRVSWQRCLDELAWRVEQARVYGITFGTEAHVGSIAPNPRAAEKLVTSVPGLTLTLDYTHFTRRGMPDSTVEPLLQYASHFHVRGARKGRLQTGFTDNVVDYRRIVKRMKQLRYTGYLGIEYVWIDWEHCNEVDNISETIRFRDFLRKVKSV